MFLAPIGVYDNQRPTDDVEADRHEPPLRSGGIVDGDGVGIEEHTFRIGEADTVFPEIRLRFDRVPDGRNICIICIQSAGSMPDCAPARARIGPPLAGIIAIVRSRCNGFRCFR
jgi:hypothetical protein